MKISDFVYLVGSDQFGLSHPLDCNCYVLDGSSELALVDTGLGLGVDEICSHLARTGFALDRLRHIIITHSHIGHWGGAEELRARTGATIWAHEDAGRLMADISPRSGHPDESPFQTLPGRLHAASL